MTSALWTRNRLTEKLGIDYPLIQGPLGGLSSQRLTAAVSNFGGLGSFGAHGLEPEAIKDVIAQIRSLTSKPFAVHLAALGAPRPAYKPYSPNWLWVQMPFNWEQHSWRARNRAPVLFIAKFC